MTTHKEALSIEDTLKLAREVLGEDRAWLESDAPQRVWDANSNAMIAIDEALAQPELCKYGQEPKSCTSSPMDCQCALDATFAQPEQRNASEHLEPVAWLWELTGEVTIDPDRADGMWLPLYTTPPPVTESHKRTWVWLTNEDVRQCSQDVAAGGKENCVDRFAYAIEAKLKEKNT